ncbi:MAG: TonB-dependent receptor [Bryobacteraceae bacterium]
MSLRTLSRIAAVVFLCALSMAIGSAQLTQATLKGSITDPSGAGVSGSQVAVKNEGTGEIRSTEADNSGAFVLTAMNPGSYTLTISASGFGTKEQREFVLNVGRITEVNIKLELATQQSEVSVVDSATPIAVSTEARLSDTFTRTEMSALPLSRDIYALPKLSAGATNIPGSANSTKLNNSPVVTVNGNRYRGNNYVLDGALNVNPNNSGEPTIVPTTESLQEAQIQTGNFSSEYGRGNGSVVNLTTKSGTNEFHGRLWGFVRNSQLNARNFFAAERAPQIYNQFGANIGGPIVRNRTFFFGSYEGTRNVQGQAVTLQLETPEFRNYTIATNPNSVAAQLFQKYPGPTPLPGTNGAKYSGQIDLPTPGGVIPAVGKAAVNLKNYSHYDQYLVRVDHSMREGKDRLSARWLNEKQGDQGATSNVLATLAQAIRGQRGPFTGDFSNLNLGYMRVFMRAVNDTRFSMQVVDTSRGNPEAVVPQLSITGITAPFGDIFLNRTKLRSYELRDTLTLERGKHSFRVGGEWRRIFKGLSLGPANAGNFNFASLSAFAADTPFRQSLNVDPSTGLPTSVPRYFRQFEYAVFAQDDWKVNSRLNLNIGIRQDYYGPTGEKTGILNSIIWGPGDNFDQRLANATAGRVQQLYQVPMFNISPRVGLAWDPFGDGKMSVRAGFSIAYAPHHQQSIAGARPNPPDVISGVIQPSVGIGTQILYGIPVPFNPQFARGLNAQGGLISRPGEPAIRISPWVVNPNIKVQYSESWFFNIQRQVRKDWTVELGYVGTTGVNLERIDDINRRTGDLLDGKTDRINPNFDTMLFVTNGVGSHYHAFTAELRHTFSRSLTFQTNYRWSKWMDNGSDTSDGQFSDNSSPGRGAQDVSCLRCEYSRSLFDIPHRFSAALLWVTPSKKFDNHLLNVITGGWQTSVIATLQSGRPFTVWCGSAPSKVVSGVNQGCDFNLDGGGGSVGPPQGGFYDRPNAPLTPVATSFAQGDFINGLFNPNIFPTPAPGQNGSLGRNTFRGPQFQSIDVSLGRNFPISGERVTLQIRAEAFNVMNKVNLYLPNTDLSLALQSNGTYSTNSIFGKSTQAFDPRLMQLSLRLTF